MAPGESWRNSLANVPRLLAGNADGLGETRKKELVKSGMLLGLRDEDDVFVVDNPYVQSLRATPASGRGSLADQTSTDFPDSMTAKWDENNVSNLLCSAFAPQLARQRADDAAQPTANIDVLITFDAQGVSSHPNHVSLYHGARAFAAALVRGKAGWASPVDLYTLTSASILRKYTSFLDVFATVAAWALRVRHEDSAHSGGLLLMNQLVGGAGLPTAWKTMTEAHKSQMVWFRYLWIGFSRYMVINDPPAGEGQEQMTLRG